jgi:hypothetical protein
MKKVFPVFIFGFIFSFVFFTGVKQVRSLTNIDSIQDLYGIRDDLNEDYVLTSDLDFDDDASYDLTVPGVYGSVAAFKTAMTSGTGWVPIGDMVTPFMGSFDGGNYTIDNLYINRPAGEYVGLFGVYFTATNQEIKNLKLRNADITAYSNIGSLVGFNYGGSITHNSVTDTLITLPDGAFFIGGLVGVNLGGSLFSSFANVSFDVQDFDINNLGDVNDLGGLVGTDAGGLISNCYSEGGDIYALISEGIGGLLGSGGAGLGDDFTTIENSYSTKNVYGEHQVGGLVGSIIGEINSSYSTGNVYGNSGNAKAGGFVGLLTGGPNSTISDSYSSGDVTSKGIGGVGSVGGFIGTVHGEGWDGLIGPTIENSYSLGSVFL